MDRTEEIILLLHTIQTKLDSIERRLDKIERSTGAMDTHIDFVERVYETVQSPLTTVLEYFGGAPVALIDS